MVLIVSPARAVFHHWTEYCASVSQTLRLYLRLERGTRYLREIRVFLGRTPDWETTTREHGCRRDCVWHKLPYKMD